ncbi:hypothetical protein DFJ73DRAFT_855656 [Zopfochytrium polystomum]|nr:hypothetical protein DFJ73DRAFT_855656 [Zopfochytrium polystomum]
MTSTATEKSADLKVQPVTNPTYEVLVDPGRFDSFTAFYPFYLGEHRNKISRRLHIFGTTIANIILARAFLGKLAKAASAIVPSGAGGLALEAGTSNRMIAFALVQGYFWAWVGHFVFEKNKPATFKYPVFSFMGDQTMWWEVVTGKRAL